MSGIKWNFAHEEAFDRMHRMIADHPVASSQIGGRNFGSVPANRLISSGVTNNAVNPLSTSATYAYNAQGQRVTRVEDEVVTHFYYTGSALLFTTVNEYVLQTQNILDPSGTIVASKRFEGQAATGQDPYAEDYFFYRYDIRGSVTTIVDGEGAVVKSYDYDEFGVTTASGDAFFNEVTFTGSIADASGLLYMNARYYNPATARFLSQDTYTGSAFDPWTQHLYAYCNNNPVNMVDPTGHVAVRATAVYVNFGDVEKTIGTASEDEASLPEIVGNIKVGIWGEPNTYADRGQGQWRYYGSDGGADVDYDKPDPDGSKGWHYHSWGWDENNTPVRSKESTETDPRETSKITPTPVPWYRVALGAIMFLGGVVATVYLVANDATVIGVADDALLSTTIGWIYYAWQIAGG